jgi:spore protease
VGKFKIRTDLALEAKESFEEDNVEIRGVKIEEDYDENTEITTTTVLIETENGAKSMGKPVGVYITLEAPNMESPDDGYHEEISKELAKHLKN